jgi:hypothetical protein
MKGTVTISVEEYDIMMKEKEHLKERVSRLELEKTPILTIELEIQERFRYNREDGYRTFVLSNNSQMFEAKNEIKSLVEETVQKFIDKNEEIKALRKMPKWFVKLFKK